MWCRSIAVDNCHLVPWEPDLASVAVNLIVELPDGEEVVVEASLDTKEGIVSSVEEWPQSIVTRDGWIEVYGGSELFFRVVAEKGGEFYRVVDKQGLNGVCDQLDWLSELFRISGQRGKYVGAEGRFCVR